MGNKRKLYHGMKCIVIIVAMHVNIHTHTHVHAVVPVTTLQGATGLPAVAINTSAINHSQW